MSVPTITSVSPAAGHTGGKTLVEIEGTGFRLPAAPAPVNGVTPEAAPSLAVTFGGAPAVKVMVASSTLAYALTPKHDPTATPLAVTVQNLDASGAPIGGELATRAAAWRFVRPNVTDGDSDLVRVIAAFHAELVRQITPNVTWPQNVDFDPDTNDTLSTIDVPEFPGLIIAATDLEENPFYSLRDPQDGPHTTDADGFTTRAPPTTVDVIFTVVGVSDSSKELLNLAVVVKRFFKKNPYLSMLADPDDASKGEVSYELDAQDSPDVKVGIHASKDNLHTFAITARVRGFDIEKMHGIELAPGSPVVGPGGADEATIEVGKTMDALVIDPTDQRGLP